MIVSLVPQFLDELIAIIHWSRIVLIGVSYEFSNGNCVLMLGLLGSSTYRKMLFNTRVLLSIDFVRF
jgi:hypothetical protein